MRELNETEQRIVERPLIRRFGFDELIEQCMAIAVRKYSWLCTYENREHEHLRGYGNPRVYEKYNKADSEGRGEMCLSDCDFAEESIVCAALVNYAKTLAAAKDRAEWAATAKKNGRDGRK